MTVIEFDGNETSFIASKEQERDFFNSEGFDVDFIDVNVSDILLYGERFDVGDRNKSTEELLLKNIVQVYFSLEDPFEENIYKELEDFNVFAPGSAYSYLDKGLVIGYIRYVVEMLANLQFRYNFKKMLYLNSIDISNVYNYRLTLMSTYGFYYRELEILENGSKYLYFAIVRTKESI